jgi:hypothetical protein
MTSQDTFEQSYRQRLLDLIYGQWAALGAPFAARPDSDDTSVIDPEALLWSSLEFLPTEPRLRETVEEWLIQHPHYLVRQRIIKVAKCIDPRTLLWQALDRRNPKSEPPTEPSEPLYGLNSTAEVVEFAGKISQRQLRDEHESTRVGRAGKGSSTLLLQARDLLGHDIRHFLLVYLLANPHGGKLRDVQDWSRHAYRSLSDAADRWKAGEIITLESGYCRLVAPEPFRQLLHIRSQPVALVKWWTVFETSIRLLRDLAKARSKGFSADAAITKCRRKAECRFLRFRRAEKLVGSPPIDMLRFRRMRSRGILASQPRHCGGHRCDTR